MHNLRIPLGWMVPRAMQKSLKTSSTGGFRRDLPCSTRTANTQQMSGWCRDCPLPIGVANTPALPVIPRVVFISQSAQLEALMDAACHLHTSGSFSFWVLAPVDVCILTFMHFWPGCWLSSLTLRSTCSTLLYRWRLHILFLVCFSTAGVDKDGGSPFLKPSAFVFFCNTFKNVFSQAFFSAGYPGNATSICCSRAD